MIDRKDFESIRKDIAEEEGMRDKIGDLSREMLSLSKQLIYSLHRGDNKAADMHLKNITEKKKKLDSYGDENPKLRYGMFSNAMQEYAEGAAYHAFISGKDIPTHSELGLDHDEYLMGICDLTGEMERKAVQCAIKEEYKMVADIKKLVEEIYVEFLKFDLRNGELRKKSDQIKWNLKRIDDIMYDLKLKGRL